MLIVLTWMDFVPMNNYQGGINPWADSPQQQLIHTFKARGGALRDENDMLQHSCQCSGFRQSNDKNAKSY